MIHFVTEQCAFDVKRQPGGNELVLNIIIDPEDNPNPEIYSIPIDQEGARKLAKTLTDKASDITVPTPEQVSGLQIPGMPGVPPTGGNNSGG